MIHVFPNDDIIHHDILSHLCQCNPIIDFEHDIVIHHAMDGREQTNKTQIFSLLKGKDEIL
jgi:hypothetical protein